MASGAAAAQAEKDKMQQAASPTLKPQSRSAVHYLAISPPRIRVTDAQGTGVQSTCIRGIRGIRETS